MKWDQFCHKQEKGICVLYYSYSIVNKTNTSEESAWRFSLYGIRKQLMFHVNIFPGTFIKVPFTVLKLCSLSATRVDIYRLTRDFHNNVSLHCLLHQNTLYGGKRINIFWAYNRSTFKLWLLTYQLGVLFQKT